MLIRKDTTDKDADVSISREQMDDLGRIKVEFWRGKVGKALPDVRPTLAESSVGVAHERTKK